MKPNFASPLLALACASPALHAQSICPSVSYIPAGCASAVTGEKPGLSVSGDFATTSDVNVVVTHTSLMGVAAVLTGQQTAPVVVDGCTLVTTGADVFVPLFPDSAGQSFLAIPVTIAVSGNEFVVQASEYEAGSDSWVVSDGMKLAFAQLCTGVQVLVDALQPSATPADRMYAYKSILNYPSAVAIPEIVAALQSEQANPTPGVLCNLPTAAPGQVDRPTVAIPCPSRALALCYLLESYRCNSRYPWDFATLDPVFAVDFQMFPTAPVAPSDSQVVGDYLSWAASLVDYTQASVYNSFNPLANKGYSWAGRNYFNFGIPVSETVSPALGPGGPSFLGSGGTPQPWVIYGATPATRQGGDPSAFYEEKPEQDVVKPSGLIQKARCRQPLGKEYEEPDPGKTIATGMT